MSWRWLNSLLLAAMLIGAAPQLFAEPPTTRPVVAVDRIGITVADIDRSVEFFAKVLDFEKVSEFETAGEELERVTGVFGARCRTARLRLGSEVLELTEYLASPGRPIPVDSRSNDRWFQHIAIVTSDIDVAYRRLRAFNIKHASTEPQRLPDWNPKAGGIRAFYFHDPDGHVLETIWFPPGKGDPRWQSTPGLFLGIDHTAIVVADTERSLAYYRDTLGLKVVGGSENYGPEQARLNNVQDAHLRITTLRAPRGPGVELLEYLSPHTGRDFPADTKPNDLWHWQVITRRERAETPTLIRDPDGHAILLESLGN